MTACLTPGCQRAPRAGYARCEQCHAAFLLSGATPVSSAAPEASVRRMGVKPLPEMTELEKRWLAGDR